jgi:hypothetical protein
VLRQLAGQHGLPAIVLEHRCLLNCLSKWVESDW